MEDLLHITGSRWKVPGGSPRLPELLSKLNVHVHTPVVFPHGWLQGTLLFCPYEDPSVGSYVVVTDDTLILDQQVKRTRELERQLAQERAQRRQDARAFLSRLANISELLAERFGTDFEPLTRETRRAAWNDAEMIIREFGLEDARATAERELRAVFGDSAVLTAEVVHDPESDSPSLAFRLHVSRDLRGRRAEFIERYIRETVIPEGAPPPALLWSYQDAAVRA